LATCKRSDDKRNAAKNERYNNDEEYAESAHEVNRLRSAIELGIEQKRQEVNSKSVNFLVMIIGDITKNMPASLASSTMWMMPLTTQKAIHAQHRL
jgi:hypothetical protein